MKLPYLLLLTLLALALPLRAAPDDIPLAPAVECTPRAGLPNFFAKVQAGGEVRIAYFGGSITAQNGWRVKTLAHFQKTYPQTKFSEINAAIGGTGSDLGVYRVRQDVLDKKPDLIFVEFAVNDGDAPPAQIYRCMEGIVRQAWRQAPDCDVCFVYTITEKIVGPLLEGKFPRAASAMENVAGHYGIPSIHMAMEVAKLAGEGKLLWHAPLPKTDAEKQAAGDKFVFAPDSVHPHPETGHELYLQAVVRSLEPIKAASKAPGPHALPAPFVKDNFENARLIPIAEATLSAGFAPLGHESGLGKQFASQLPNLHRAAKPGETVSFKFKGTDCAIYDLINTDSGQVIITLDDKPPRIAPIFDKYTAYARPSRLTIASGLPDAIHTVKIEIHPDQPDKAKLLAETGKTIDKPERYDGVAFYPGAILLMGELVK
jgi:hypothetical protein